MNRVEEQSQATVNIEDSRTDSRLQPNRNGKMPFVLPKDKAKPSLGDTGRLLLIGAGIVLVLLLFAFSGISRRSSSAQKSSVKPLQTQKATQASDDMNSPISVTPILDAGRPREQSTNDILIDADQIGRLGKKELNQPGARSLGNVPPFGNTRSWQSPPYQPVSEDAAIPDTNSEPKTAAQPSNSREGVVDKASLVFVRSNTSPTTIQKFQEATPQLDLGIGLVAGTRLRARLESAISTAVQTPVVAVIQYNYEQNGEIVIPAGTRVFGHLESADRSGYLGIRFESLQTPDGSSFSLNAAPTDLQLRPLRGRVEGRQSGKSIFVRSFAGVGQIAATLVGRGGLNQPLSESDLLRERLTNNIGEASDQTVARLAVTEHIVVSVPAGIEIYVVLQKAVKEDAAQSSATRSRVQTTSAGLDELRQLLQLQRELNQTATNQ